MEQTLKFIKVSCIIVIDTRLNIKRRIKLDSQNNKKDVKRHHKHHHHHGKHRFWKIVGIIFGVLVVAGAIAFGYAYSNLRSAANNAYNPEKLPNQVNGSLKDVLNADKPVSIMLLGTDTGEFGRDYKGRTDTIMIMTLDPAKKTSHVVSFPRDMKVNLPDYPDYSPAKINSAYTYGGVKELSTVMDRYFEVPINGYILVNMGGLVKAIDQVGGIEVTSPLTFDYEGYHFTKGKKVHMNGKKALQFGRMRYDDPKGDYGRQERQRLVIMALLKKSASYKAILNKDFLHSMSSQMQTNLSFDDLTKLAMDYRDSSNTVVTDHVQGSNDNEDGVAFQSVSLKERQRISDILRPALGLKKVTLD